MSDERVSVTLPSDQARRVAEAMMRSGYTDIARGIMSECNGNGDVTLRPRVESASIIASVCLSARIGVGVRFGVAASEGRYKKNENAAL